MGVSIPYQVRKNVTLVEQRGNERYLLFSKENREEIDEQHL